MYRGGLKKCVPAQCALEVGGSVFGNLANRQAGGVGGDDGAGAAVGGHAFEQALLDLEIFGDDFDDPVGLGAPGEIVFEVADGDAGSGLPE